MSRVRYYTATTLDGFLADEHDSLDWLFEQQQGEPGGPGDFDTFMQDVGAQVMGATTYEWVCEHEPGWDPAPGQPVWVFSHRDLAPRSDAVRVVQGPVADHLDDVVASAGGKDVWVVGGGDLAGQFADLGRLDEVVVSVAPVVVGAGRPLLPRRHDLELRDVARNGDFVVATYGVRGPRS